MAEIDDVCMNNVLPFRRQRHQSKGRPSGTAWDVLAGAAKSIGAIVKSGFEIASLEVQRERAMVCGACEWWDLEGNFGLGKCRICRCTKVKLTYAATRCPLGKWENTTHGQ
jgi:hypothetical protein